MNHHPVVAQLRDREAIQLSGLFHCVPVMRVAAERIEELERELWLVAECIFRNMAAGEMKHWAQGIHVKLSAADAAPRLTLDSPASGPEYVAQTCYEPREDFRCKNCDKPGYLHAGNEQGVLLCPTTSGTCDCRDAFGRHVPGCPKASGRAESEK